MISREVLAEAVKGIKNITSFDLCVSDETGAALAGTFTPDVTCLNDIVSFIASGQDILEDEERCFVKIKYGGRRLIGTVTVAGTGDDKARVAGMVALQLSQLYEAYDRGTIISDYINNLLLGKILPTNIDSDAKAVGLEPNRRRDVCIIVAKEEYVSEVKNAVKAMVEKRDDFYVVSVERGRIVIVTQAENEDFEKEAGELFNELNRNAGMASHIGFGRPVDTISRLPEAYREAVTAIEVCETFYPERSIVSYDKLGLGRLIINCPDELCDMFLKEHFDKGAIEKIDEETFNTVNVFFENSLNISETARKLFIHRNTLIYRLNKLQKMLGLDVKKLDDAITFKVSVMVYRKYMEDKRKSV